MQCFDILDISLSRLIKSHSELVSNKGKYVRWKIDPRDILQDDVYSLLCKYGEPAVLIAQLPEKFSGGLHSDKDGVNTNFNHNPALNMLLSGSHSMQWFDIKTPGTNVPLPGVKRYTTQWKSSNGESPIAEWTTGDVVLVRTDIPHQVHNTGTVPRTTLSIRWTGTHIDWEEFKEWARTVFIPALTN